MTADRKQPGSMASPNHRVRVNDASMHNGLMSSESRKRDDRCCGIHGAMRERKGAKKATSAARRRHDKEVINKELEESEMRRWETRGGRYVIEVEGTSLREFTNGVETAASHGHSDNVFAVKEAERRVAVYAAVDKINFKEVGE